MRFLLAFVLLLTAAAPAGAASVSLEPPAEAYDNPVATFRAAPGERNDLTVTAGPDATKVHSEYGSITFTDPGAELTGGKGCAVQSKHIVVCSATTDGVSAAEAYLGDGNDTYHVENTRDDHSYVRAFGGPGSDRLVGGAFNDELSGGKGNDVVDGGLGDDFLTGGKGRDVMRGGAGYDQIMPGPGRDDVDCGGATQQDQVYGPETGEALVGCDDAEFPYPGGASLGLTPNPTVAQGEARYYVGCPELDVEGQDPVRCTGTLTLSYRGTTIATARKLRKGPTVPVFTKAGRTLAQRPGGVRADAVLTVNGHASRWVSIVAL